MDPKKVVIGMLVRCVDGEKAGLIGRVRTATSGKTPGGGQFTVSEVKVKVAGGPLEWWPLHNLEAV